MIIKSVTVKNFRCLREATLHMGRLTVLVGENGAGKSTFLKALDLFYTPNANYTEEDFFNRDTSQNIEITVTFGELTSQEREMFARYVDGDTLTVTKVMTWPRDRKSQKYYGETKRNPDFQSVQEATRIRERRKLYNELRSREEYSDLPELPSDASRDQIERALETWEKQHPEKLETMREENQFFGFKEVGHARLERFTRYILIPAVRDASQDAVEGRGSIISLLMDLVVRKALSQREDIQQLRQETQRKYKEIMDPRRLNELKQLAKSMNQTIQTFAPGTEIIIDWNTEEEIQIPMPKSSVLLREHGFVSSVERAGHGTQRAFILTMLQHLAIAETSQTQTGNNQSSLLDNIISSPSIILAIEEPEFYQHPTRLRHLANVFLELTSKGIPGVGQVQVIYTTHSPLLLDLRRFDQIRVLRKKHIDEGTPKQTEVYQASIEKVTQIIEYAETGNTGSYTPEGTLARLQTLMTPWTNEGFFAEVVVLVEGEEDRAVILGVAEFMGYNFDQEGIAVIPCNGKTNLVKVAAVFKAFSIPIYVIWDSDYGAKDPKVPTNHSLLRFVGKEVKDYPEMVGAEFACFKKNMTKALKREIGDDIYNEAINSLINGYGYEKADQAKKNPQVIRDLLKRAWESGKRCEIIESIVKNIIELRRKL